MENNYLLILLIIAVVNFQRSNCQLGNNSTTRTNHGYPEFMIVAPSLIVPGEPYIIIVNLFPHKIPQDRVRAVRVEATLLRDEAQIEAEHVDVLPGTVNQIKLKVPDHLADVVYQLQVVGNEYRHFRGSKFDIKKELTVHRPLPNLQIYTSQPVYVPGQTVGIRILPEESSTAFTGYIRISLVSPEGLLVEELNRRILDVNGLDIEFPLSERCSLGKWSIKAQIESKEFEKTFNVLELDTGRFALELGTVGEISTTTQCVSVSITAKYTDTGLPVLGRLELLAEVVSEEERRNYSISDPAWEVLNRRASFQYLPQHIQSFRSDKDCTAENIPGTLDFFNGHVEVSLPVSLLLGSSNLEQNLNIILRSSLTDNIYGETSRGFRMIKIYKSSLNLRVHGVNSKWILPDLPLQIMAECAWNPEDSVSPQLFVSNRIQLSNGTSVYTTRISKIPEPVYEGEHRPASNSVWKYWIDLRSLVLPYSDVSVREVKRLFLQLECETKKEKADQTINFAVRQEQIHRLHISTSTRKHKVEENAVFHVRSNKFISEIQYIIVSRSTLVTSRTIYMEPYLSRTFHFLITQEMAPSATILVYGIDRLGNIISDSLSFPVDGNDQKKVWIDLSESWNGNLEILGSGGPGSRLYGSFVSSRLTELLPQIQPDRLKDMKIKKEPHAAGNRFSRSHLLVFTDAVAESAESEEDEDCPPGLVLCPPGECQKACNICEDRNGCDDDPSVPFNLLPGMVSGTHWVDLDIPQSGVSLKNITLRNKMNYILQTIEPGLYPRYRTYDLKLQPEFSIKMSGPRVARVGEGVSITVNLQNYAMDTMEGTVHIKDSPEFSFILVPGENTPKAEKVIEVVLGPYSSKQLLVPVRLIKTGEVTVSAQLLSGTVKDRTTFSFTVEEKGFLERRHTSLQVDLPRPGYSLHHLHVEAEGDNEVRVLVSEDVVGPLEVSNLPTRSCEESISRLGKALQIIRYRKYKNVRLESEYSGVNLVYQDIINYQNSDGGFPFFTRTRGGESSVWTTGYALAVLSEASVSGMTIDESLIESSVSWLVSSQLTSGRFREMYMFPDDSQSPVEFQDVSLTAHVVIGLFKASSVAKNIQVMVDSSVTAATSWLSKQLYKLDRHGHPHDIAIVAYALHITNTNSKEAAFQLLSKYRQEEGTFMYWGSEREPVQTFKRVGRIQELLPNPTQCCHSLSIRATSYALMVYTLREEFIILPIVRWINSRRQSSSGWSSEHDSVLSLAALVEYSLAQQSVGEETASVEITLQGNKKLTRSLTLSSIDRGPHSVNIHNFYGTVKVEVKGQGRYLVQVENRFLDRPAYRRPGLTAVQSLRNTVARGEAELSENLEVSHVQHGPPVSAYNLEASVTGDAASFIVRTCQRWLCPYETIYSGPTVLSVEPPTGYSMSSTYLRDLEASSTVISSTSTSNSTVFLTFNYLSPDFTCVDLTLKQDYLVTNPFPVLRLSLYSHLSPEHYNSSLVVLPVRDYSTCDLCASHACDGCSSRLASHSSQLHSMLVSTWIVGYLTISSVI